MKGTALKIVSLLGISIIFWLASVPLAEYGHLAGARLMGGSLTIIGTHWAGFFKGEWIQMPAQGLWFVYFSHSLAAFLFFFPLWLFARWTPTPWDLNIEFPAAFIGMLQFSAGVAEITLAGPPNERYMYAPIFAAIAILGIIMVMWFYAPRLMAWMGTHNG